MHYKIIFENRRMWTRILNNNNILNNWFVMFSSLVHDFDGYNATQSAHIGILQKNT